MNYNCDQTELNRKPVVLSVLQSWINGSFFQPSHFQSIPSAHLVYSENAESFVWNTAQRTTWQSEANWSCWPLLNHITGDHISLFIGHKWSTSVSTWPNFHTKHLKRDSSPISVVLLCLFNTVCVSYIKHPRFFSPLLCQRVYFWQVFITKHSVERTMLP